MLPLAKTKNTPLEYVETAPQAGDATVESAHHPRAPQSLPSSSPERGAPQKTPADLPRAQPGLPQEHGAVRPARDQDIFAKRDVLMADIAALKNYFASKGLTAIGQELGDLEHELRTQTLHPQSATRYLDRGDWQLELAGITEKVARTCLGLGEGPSMTQRVDFAWVAETCVSMYSRVHGSAEGASPGMHALLRKAADQQHKAATGNDQIYTAWYDEHMRRDCYGDNTPTRPPSQIDVIGCVRAARLFHLQAAFGGPNEIRYAQRWDATYLGQISREVRPEDLTRAELERLSEPGPKPEWSWLPGLQQAAETAARDRLRQLRSST